MRYKDRVGQRAADRSTAIRCHGRQQEARSQPQPAEDKALHGTAHRGDGFPLWDDVRERLGGCGGHVADTQEGQVTGEDGHGRVQVEAILTRAMMLGFQARVRR